MCATIAITVKMMKLVMKILWNSLASCSLNPDKDITSPPKRPMGPSPRNPRGRDPHDGCHGKYCSCRAPRRKQLAAAYNTVRGHARLAGRTRVPLSQIAQSLRGRDAHQHRLGLQVVIQHL